MNARSGFAVGGSFALVSIGLFIIAFNTVVDVFQDPRRTELVGSTSNLGENLAPVIFAGLFIASGVAWALLHISRATGRGRLWAGVSVWGSIFWLVFFHAKLFINSVTAAAEVGGAEVTFTAGYFFHTGAGYTFAALYVIFLITLALAGALVGGVAYLLAPDRFRGVFGRRADWESTEPLAVTTGMFVVASLMVFLVFFVQLAINADRTNAEFSGFIGQNLVGLHYFLAFLLGLLSLSVAARAFWVNWSTQGTVHSATLEDVLDNVGRVERVLLVAVLVVDFLLLTGPSIAGSTALSQDPVFRLTTHMLAFFLLLVGLPYALYRWSLRRLRWLLDHDMGPKGGRTPFTNRSLWVVLAHVGGLVLIGTISLATSAADPGRSEPLGLLIAFTAWSALVFLVAGVSLRLRGGVPVMRVRDEGGAVSVFAFLVLGLSLALMLWGAGNTYEATYSSDPGVLEIRNTSVWGADVLARFAGALVAGVTIVVGLAVLSEAAGIRRPLLSHYLLVLGAVVVGGLTVFTVDVWSTGSEGTQDAFAGLAFHQFYLRERLLVSFVILGGLAASYFGIGRVASLAARRRSLVALEASA